MQLASTSTTHHFCIWCVIKLVFLVALLPLLDSLHKSVFHGTIKLANCLYRSAAEVVSVSGACEALHCLCCRPPRENSDKLTAEQLPSTRKTSAEHAEIFCEMGAEDSQPQLVSDQHDLPAESSSQLLLRFWMAHGKPQLRRTELQTSGRED